MSYMQICIVKICSKEANTIETNISTSVDSSVSNTRTIDLENRVKMLEDKLFQLRTEINNINEVSQNSNIQLNIQSKINNNVDEKQQVQLGWDSTSKEEIKEVIIKDKDKILNLMKESSPNLTEYASNVFIRIINESLNTNNSEVATMRELFKSCKLIASSKEGGLLVFNEVDNMVKMAPNSKYKKYLESLFKRFIGVDYTLYTLQDHQYEVLEDELKNPVQEIAEENFEVEEPNLTKIDELFGDIIVEKND